MSLDSVDDLEAAEDTIGVLTAQLGAVRAFRLSNPWTGLDDGPVELRDGVDSAFAVGVVYCRPSCGTGGAPHNDPDSDCGCPCHAHPEEGTHDEHLQG